MPPPVQSMPRFAAVGCFLMGLVGTGVFGYVMIWLPLRANLFYVETTCVVLDKRLAERDGEDGKMYRPEILIEYAVGGVAHRTWTYDAAGGYSSERADPVRTLAEFRPGGRYPCWYDPGKPGRAVLTRRFTWWGLMVLLPMFFMLIGAVGLLRMPPAAPPPAPSTPPTPEMRRLAGWSLGLVFGGFFVAMVVSGALIFAFVRVGAAPWLMPLLFFGPFLVYIGVLVFAGMKYFAHIRRTMPSPERAAAQRVSALPRGGAPAKLDGGAWPTVPAPAVDPTPGSALRYRLTSRSSPWLSLAVISVLALFWNGIVSIFVVHAIDGLRNGKPELILTVFLIPFVLIGLVLIAAGLAAVVQAGTGLLSGRSSVEVAEFMMRPGGSYEFLVEQSGPFRLGQVRLLLACTESATYTQGTDTRTETKEVANEEVGRAEALPADGFRGSLMVPLDAMHSFEADHNKITWVLRLKGRVAGVLRHESEYPVVILPAPEGTLP